MSRGIPVPLLRLASPLRQVYWRIVKPRKFGVKVLVLHPEDPDRFLLVRHSYGDRQLTQDQLTILRGQAVTAELNLNREIAATRWVPLDLSGLPADWRVSHWAQGWKP